MAVHGIARPYPPQDLSRHRGPAMRGDFQGSSRFGSLLTGRVESICPDPRYDFSCRHLTRHEPRNLKTSRPDSTRETFQLPTCDPVRLVIFESIRPDPTRPDPAKFSTVQIRPHPTRPVRFENLPTPPATVRTPPDSTRGYGQTTRGSGQTHEKKTKVSSGYRLARRRT